MKKVKESKSNGINKELSPKHRHNKQKKNKAKRKQELEEEESSDEERLYVDR